MSQKVMMNKVKLFLVLLGAEMFVASCASTSVKPGAEKVRILPSEPKGCLYQAEIFSIQIDETHQNATPEMNIDTRNDLRNKAFDNGANVLIFAADKNKAAITPGLASNSAKPGTKVDLGPEVKKETVFIGHAYKCPASIVNQ